MLRAMIVTAQKKFLSCLVKLCKTHHLWNLRSKNLDWICLVQSSKNSYDYSYFISKWICKGLLNLSITCICWAEFFCNLFSNCSNWRILSSDVLFFFMKWKKIKIQVNYFGYIYNSMHLNVRSNGLLSWKYWKQDNHLILK